MGLIQTKEVQMEFALSEAVILKLEFCYIKNYG